MNESLMFTLLDCTTVGTREIWHRRDEAIQPFDSAQGRDSLSNGWIATARSASP